VKPCNPELFGSHLNNSFIHLFIDQGVGMSALANHEVFVDEMRCKEAYQWSGNSTGLALIDHKVRADEMRCKVCQESDNSTRVEFKLRLHTIGEDRKYFANKFDPVASRPV
jgi:hypothetical protein